MLYPKIPLSLHRFSTKSHRVKRLKGEMVEWSITAVLKTAVLRGTGGSNPSLSANRLQISKYRSFNKLRYFCFILTCFFRVRKEGAETPKILSYGYNLVTKR